MSPGRAQSEGPRQVGEVLKYLLRKKRFFQKGRYGRLVDAWRQSVGPAIADQTRIAGFRDGEVLVEVASPALLQELSAFMKPLLLEQLRGKPGGAGVADIQFRLAREEER